MIPRLTRHFAPLFAVLWASPTVLAQVEVAKLTAPDGTDLDHFGRVALSGDTLVVGAPFNDSPLPNAGGAYVFVDSPNGWAFQQKLVASDAQDDDGFGRSVAIDGDTVVVGAPFEDTGGSAAGAAYVFVRNATVWTEQQKLQATDLKPFAWFGISVSLEGDALVVGASLADDQSAVPTGAAYVFSRTANAWSEDAKLLASDGQAGDGFGTSVGLDGTRIVVGSPFRPQLTVFPGAAYVFVGAGPSWVEDATIVPAQALDLDFVGTSVSVDADTIAIGAREDGGNTVRTGSVYVYVHDGNAWNPEDRLIPADVDDFDAFGVACQVQGDRILAGSELAQDGGSGYLFERAGNSWNETAKVVSGDISAGDELGGFVALDGDILALGAVGDDDLGSGSGAAYVFALGALGQNYCSANDNSSGGPAAISASGSSTVADNDLALSALGLPPGVFGYFLMSETQDFVPLFGGSEGNLCLGQPLVRFAGNVLNSGAGGAVQFMPDLTNLPQNTTISAGETWNFQLWFRDDNPGPTSNTTDGVSILFD